MSEDTFQTEAEYIVAAQRLRKAEERARNGDEEIRRLRSDQDVLRALVREMADRMRTISGSYISYFMDNYAENDSLYKIARADLAAVTDLISRAKEQQ